MTSSEPVNIKLASVSREEFDTLKKQISKITNLIKEKCKLI